MIFSAATPAARDSGGQLRNNKNAGRRCQINARTVRADQDCYASQDVPPKLDRYIQETKAAR